MQRVLLFDLENTLIRESKDVSAYYFEAIRNAYGLSIDNIDISRYEGLTTQETLIRILSENGLSMSEIYAKHELFLQELPYAHYNVAGHDKIVLIDGAKDLLEHAHKKGYIMGVASGQLERILRNMFDGAGMRYDSYFKFGTYGDASEQMSKIILASIDVAHKEYKADKGGITFISNIERHVIAAHALGINSIGVITDAYSFSEFSREGKSGHVVRNLKDCRKLL